MRMAPNKQGKKKRLSYVDNRIKFEYQDKYR